MKTPNRMDMIPRATSTPVPPKPAAAVASPCMPSSTMPPMMSKTAAMIASAATIVTPRGRFGPNWSDMALPRS